MDDGVEGFVEGRATVGIAGGVLFNRAYVNGACPGDLGPTRGSGQQMGISKWDVRGGNGPGFEVRRGDLYAWIRKGGTSNVSQRVGDRVHPFTYVPVIRQLVKRLFLARLGALSVVDMKKENFLMAQAGDCRRHAAIQPAADQDDGLLAGVAHGQTPRACGSQMYLCSCSW